MLSILVFAYVVSYLRRSYRVNLLCMESTINNVYKQTEYTDTEKFEVIFVSFGDYNSPSTVKVRHIFYASL